MANIALDKPTTSGNGLLANNQALANGTLTPATYQVLPKPQLPNYVPLDAPTVQPPAPVATAIMGGNAPVQQAAAAPVTQTAPVTGGTAPVATTATAVTGGNAPVSTLPAVTPVPQYQLPALDGSSYVATATGNPASTAESPYQVVTDNMNQLLSQDSPYIQNARLRGIEQAQSRGLRNSSIAAGASERSAIEAAQPILSEIQDLTSQRENLAFQGEQSQLERIQQVNNAMLDYQFQQSLQNNAALQQDWLSSNQYTREFNGQLAQVPIANAAALSQMIAQYALENPEVYTPSTISGMQNFFTGSLAAILQQYFPSVYGTAPTGG